MLNFSRVLIYVVMLAGLCTAAYADEGMRAGSKTAISKGCVSHGKDDPALKDINVPEYCDCTANRLVENMSDDELKQALLTQDKNLIQTKMIDAASYCMASNSQAKVFLKNTNYKACMDREQSKDKDVNIPNIKDYCECYAAKMTDEFTPQDMREYMTLGLGKADLKDTTVANKAISVSLECYNQVVK